MSFTEGTGNRGSELWKLYSIGLGPENNFTNTYVDSIKTGSRVKQETSMNLPIIKPIPVNSCKSSADTMTQRKLQKKHAITGTVLKMCYKTNLLDFGLSQNML